MCGIAGIFHYQCNGEVSRKTLESMAQSIEHRGPDDEEFYQEFEMDKVFHDPRIGKTAGVRRL